MTDDDMVAALTAKGYRIQPPLTQENCKHTRTRGSCGGGAGGWKSEWWCLDCGKHSIIETPPTLDQTAIFQLQPQN